MLQLTINYEIMDCNYVFGGRNNGSVQKWRGERKNALT